MCSYLLRNLLSYVNVYEYIRSLKQYAVRMNFHRDNMTMHDYVWLFLSKYIKMDNSNSLKNSI